MELLGAGIVTIVIFYYLSKAFVSLFW